MRPHICVEDCEFCTNKGEQAKAERDEPLSAAEEAELDDAYERRYGRDY